MIIEKGVSYDAVSFGEIEQVVNGELVIVVSVEIKTVMGVLVVIAGVEVTADVEVR